MQDCASRTLPLPRQWSLLSLGYHSDSNAAENELFCLTFGSLDATDGSGNNDIDVVSIRLHCAGS